MGFEGMHLGGGLNRFAAPGVYAAESQMLSGHGLDLGIIRVGSHLLKIGGATNFDDRRETLCGRGGDYGFRDADGYFDMEDWRPCRFRETDEGKAFETERDIHAFLNVYRLTMDEAQALHHRAHGKPWPRSTRPEIFKLSFGDRPYAEALPPTPGPSRRPKHGERYSRRLRGEF